jgi:hypothetical protein
MFYVGQEVVCVSADYWFPDETHPVLPESGQIYRIRSTFVDHGIVGLRLEEIECGIGIDGTEDGFQAKYFKPIAKTDISIFTAMLSPTKVGA